MFRSIGRDYDNSMDHNELLCLQYRERSHEERVSQLENVDEGRRARHMKDSCLSSRVPPAERGIILSPSILTRL